MSNLPFMMITGTSRGIGKMLAEYYSRANYNVIGCSRTESELKHTNYHHFICDLTKPKELGELFKILRKEFPEISVLINNAGISSKSFLLLTNPEQVLNLFNTNVVSTINVMKETVKLMKKRNWGRIINLTSINVPLFANGSALYSASKISLEYYAKAISKEIAQYGVTINNIGLSFVKNSGMVNELSEEVIEQISKNLSLNSFITIEDVIYLIDTLISIKANFITGQTIYTSGALCL